MNERWRSRKLWTCVLGMTYIFILRMRGVAIDDNTMYAMCVGMVGYCGANVLQKKVVAKGPTGAAP